MVQSTLSELLSSTPRAVASASLDAVVSSLGVRDEDVAEPDPHLQHVVRLLDDAPVVREAVRALKRRSSQGADADGVDDDVNEQPEVMDTDCDEPCSGNSAPPVAALGMTVAFGIGELEQRLQLRTSLAVAVKRFRASGHGEVGIGDAPSFDPHAASHVTTFRKEQFAELEVVGQFNNGFILARLGAKDLYIIDQHASDEIYNFETLQRTTVLHSQRLLVPMVIDMAPDEELTVLSHMDVFERNGFLLRFDDDALPGRKVQMLARPESKDTVFDENDVRELAALVRDSGGSVSASLRPSRVRAMFASRACRSSVMIGEPLSMERMRAIVRQLGTLNAPWACPHGRPTMRHLSTLETE